MSSVDHRNLSIPLFLLGAALSGAGLVALLAGAFLDIGPNNAAGAVGAGVVLLFGSVAVTVLLNPASSLGLQPQRTVPLAAAAILVLMASAVGAGAAFGGIASVEATETDPGVGAASGIATEASSFLGTEDFAGTLQGAMTGTPIGGLGGTGTTSETHELQAPAGARSARIELAWTTASPGGAVELDLRLETEDGEEVASSSGGSVLVLDATDLPDAPLRLVVSIPAGSASAPQEYRAYASYFSDAIPASFTAAEA